MKQAEVFVPDWASPPGATAQDLLREQAISVVSFAERLGLSAFHTQALLSGQEPLTPVVAASFERYLSVPASFWMRREEQYRQDLSRVAPKPADWVKSVPYRDMARLGWLQPTGEPVKDCLKFFGCASVPEWLGRNRPMLESTAFKLSGAASLKFTPIAVWLRESERRATSVDCEPWSRDRLRTLLPAFRHLTREREPKKFIPRLQQLCASAGVAVVVLRAPTGCAATAATRFISDDKALIALSFRFLSDDQFWFAFFHEVAHLLLHSPMTPFIEGIPSPQPSEEGEADDFAANALIPSEFEPSLHKLSANLIEIARFARLIDVSPGVVVGRLQKLGHLKYSQGNRARTRYKWDDTELTVSRGSGRAS